jgi:dimethylamine monooxygenase subunit A
MRYQAALRPDAPVVVSGQQRINVRLDARGDLRNSRGMPHYAFLDGPYRLAMGLHALAPEDWLEPGADEAQQMAERRRLLAERPAEVLAALPESAAACRELYALVCEHLARRYPERWQQAGAALVDQASGERFAADPAEPLATLGRMVQEDFCLMQKGPAGYRLTAAVLCFPTHWRLADKLGRPLDVIHIPVPDFEARLARPVDRFFVALQALRPVWRVNWSIVDTPELFRPPELRRRRRTIDPARAGEQLWLRVERQTLRRLAGCGDVVFGIRNHVQPLAEVTEAPAVAQALALRLREMPAEMADYKGLTTIRAPLLDYLERRAGAAPSAAISAS